MVHSNLGGSGSIFGPSPDSYVADIAFYAQGYIFGIHGSASPTPYTWSSDLLPTQANPLPFSGEGAISYQLQWMQGGLNTPMINFTVENYSVGTPQAVPLPAAAWMFGAGLAGLGAMTRRQRQIKI